mmetsp:Transcript_37088/g.81320  ORF Transcript_37088/g.81320 Transcript_37088/m.81320 type:complete len:254 (+) Transcript_37088:343-1104(+)
MSESAPPGFGAIRAPDAVSVVDDAEVLIMPSSIISSSAAASRAATASREASISTSASPLERRYSFLSSKGRAAVLGWLKKCLALLTFASSMTTSASWAGGGRGATYSSLSGALLNASCPRSKAWAISLSRSIEEASLMLSTLSTCPSSISLESLLVGVLSGTVTKSSSLLPRARLREASPLVLTLYSAGDSCGTAASTTAGAAAVAAVAATAAPATAAATAASAYFEGSSSASAFLSIGSRITPWIEAVASAC